MGHIDLSDIGWWIDLAWSASRALGRLAALTCVAQVLGHSTGSRYSSLHSSQAAPLAFPSLDFSCVLACVLQIPPGADLCHTQTFLSVTVGLVRMVSSLFAVAHDLGKLIPRRTTSSSGLFPTSP